MFKKISIFSLSMLLTLGVVSCQSEVSEEFTPNYGEVIYNETSDSDDSKLSGLIGTVVSLLVNKIQSAAKDTATKIVNKGVSKVQSKVENFLQNNFFDLIGLKIFKTSEEYTIKDIYNSVEALSNSMSELKEIAQELSNQLNKVGYQTQFNLFNQYYNAAKVYKTDFENLTIAANLPATSSEDKKSTFNSVETSIRKDEKINQKTALYETTIKFGYSILGDEYESDNTDTSVNLTEYSIFQLVRALVEDEIPFDAKRKYYEDNYLSSVIASFESLYALNQFDLTYNLSLNGIENFIVASDGQVLGFTYNDKNYYYWYEPLFTEDIKTKYATEFKNNNMESYSFPTATVIPNYSDIKYAFDYYSYVEKINNAILKSYNDFARTVDNDYIKLESSDFNRKLAKKANTIHFSDFVINAHDDSGNLGTDRAYNCNINFNNFDYIEKSTWENFVKHIKKSAGDKTFYEYLTSMGFSLPRDSSAPSGYQCLLPLGVTKYDKDESYNSNRNLEVTHASIIYINLDSKVSAYSSNSLQTVYVYHLKYRSGNCNEKWHFTRTGYYIGVKDGARYTNIIKGSSKDYMNLNLVSWPGLVGDKKVKTGVINYNSLPTSY